MKVAVIAAVPPTRLSLSTASWRASIPFLDRALADGHRAGALDVSRFAQRMVQAHGAPLPSGSRPISVRR